MVPLFPVLPSVWLAKLQSPHTPHHVATCRSRLGHETADKLVYCHESIHLRNECCKAGYKEPFEKWQFNSDDEDDGSDTEEDLTLTISQLIV